MSTLEVAVRLEQESYRPGDELVGAFQVVGESPEGYAIELSVLWRTEGKGDEDLGVLLFQEWSATQRPFDFARPERFTARLPRSPLTYDGELIKIRWLARVRVRWKPDGEALAEEQFQLGARAMRVGRRPRNNPFSTRFVRPGAIPYQFTAGVDAAALATRLEGQGWRGQIVGPHGSGKSTLLATLLPELRRRRAVVTVELHTDRRRVPALAWSPEPTLLMVDGYEQLSWWGRRRIQGNCRRWGWGLLATGHGDLGLPLLYRTDVTPALARALVEGLLTEGQRVVVANVDLLTAAQSA